MRSCCRVASFLNCRFEPWAPLSLQLLQLCKICSFKVAAAFESASPTLYYYLHSPEKGPFSSSYVYSRPLAIGRGLIFNFDQAHFRRVLNRFNESVPWGDALYIRSPLYPHGILAWTTTPGSKSTSSGERPRQNVARARPPPASRLPKGHPGGYERRRAF